MSLIAASVPQDERALNVIFSEKRKQLGIKQTDVAKEVGCTPSLISQFENGNAYLSIPKLIAYAEVLDIEITVDMRPIERCRKIASIRLRESHEILGQLQESMRGDAALDMAAFGEQVARLFCKHELITPSDLVALGLDENVAPPMPPVTPANAG